MVSIREVGVRQPVAKQPQIGGAPGASTQLLKQGCKHTADKNTDGETHTRTEWGRTIIGEGVSLAEDLVGKIAARPSPDPDSRIQLSAKGFGGKIERNLNGQIKRSFCGGREGCFASL